MHFFRLGLKIGSKEENGMFLDKEKASHKPKISNNLSS
jgi:hypothetical protein